MQQIQLRLWFQTASVLEEVNKLKDENFLIIHGTADGGFSINFTLIIKFWFAALKFSIVCICVCSKAKVHFQHSAELLSRLVKVEANYSLQLYPDEGHILRGPRSIQHFQRIVVNYFQNCLKQSLFLDPVEDDEEEDD